MLFYREIHPEGVKVGLNLLHDSQHHRNIQKDYYKKYF